MILPDNEIKRLGILEGAYEGEATGSPSYGYSSYGYDLRLGRNFILPDGKPFELHPAAARIVLDPGECVLGETVEVFHMPRDVTGLVKDKSTYARQFISVFNTVIEAGWKGRLTLEIVNHSPRRVSLYAERGIAQVIFLRGDACDVAYNERKGGGKYQGATTVEGPR